MLLQRGSRCLLVRRLISRLASHHHCLTLLCFSMRVCVSAAANGVRAARTRELAERDGSAAPTAAQLAVDRSLPLTASVQTGHHGHSNMDARRLALTRWC